MRLCLQKLLPGNKKDIAKECLLCCVLFDSRETGKEWEEVAIRRQLHMFMFELYLFTCMPLFICSPTLQSSFPACILELTFLDIEDEAGTETALKAQIKHQTTATDVPT